MEQIKIEALHYQIGDKQILSDVSLSIHKGECISIIGESGSGKSSLLKMLANLMMPTRGFIYLNQKEYHDIDPIALRRQVSYCIQIPYLFGATVKENLVFPYEVRQMEVNMERILEMLQAFNLDASYLDKEVKGLSGGEMQRIALARNLLIEPEVLLLDEITSALDQNNSLIVERYIESLNKKGITVIWITHSIEQSQRIFNRRIQMANGKIIKDEVIQ